MEEDGEMPGAAGNEEEMPGTAVQVFPSGDSFYNTKKNLEKKGPKTRATLGIGPRWEHMQEKKL